MRGLRMDRSRAVTGLARGLVSARADTGSPATVRGSGRSPAWEGIAREQVIAARGVPALNHSRLSLVSEHRDSAGAERESSTGARLQLQPAGSHHAQDMTMRKYEHVPAVGHERQHAVQASSNLAWALAAGTAIAPQVPARIARANLGRGQTFKIAVVPFAQLIAEARAVTKTGLLTRLTRPAQGLHSTVGKHRSASFGLSRRA